MLSKASNIVSILSQSVYKILQTIATVMNLSILLYFIVTVHYQRIVHRDIKPSNLLVDSEGRVKVADLGVSAELPADGELLTGFAGTPAFAAPETMKSSAQYLGTVSLLLINFQTIFFKHSYSDKAYHLYRNEWFCNPIVWLTFEVYICTRLNMNSM